MKCSTIMWLLWIYLNIVGSLLMSKVKTRLKIHVSMEEKLKKFDLGFKGMFGLVEYDGMMWNGIC